MPKEKYIFYMCSTMMTPLFPLFPLPEDVTDFFESYKQTNVEKHSHCFYDGFFLVLHLLLLLYETFPVAGDALKKILNNRNRLSLSEANLTLRSVKSNKSLLILQ